MDTLDRHDKARPPAAEMILRQADIYRLSCLRNSLAHYDVANAFDRRNRALGIPTLVTTSVVGTTIFATLAQGKESFAVGLATGMASVAAAVMSALQTFLAYSERALQHKTAANQYALIRREIEMFALDVALSRQSPAEGLEALRRLVYRLSKLTLQTPKIPPRFWKKTNAAIQVPAVSGSPVMEMLAEASAGGAPLTR